jgi:ribosomal protein S18 acetylase RimI-like enzyme
MVYTIEKLDHEQAIIRKTIFEFLADREPHALFILGNLNMNFPKSHLYAAVKEGHWVGIAGYYELPKSLVPFSVDVEATRALVRHAAARHRQIDYVTGIDYVAAPAYDELLRLGYQSKNDPQQVFMERTGLPTLQRWEASARLMKESDYAGVAHLLRCLDGTWDESMPPTDEEHERAGYNPLRMVVAVKDRIVATAASNGIGIRAYQILGVATHPDFRRSGYARSVVSAMMHYMANQGGSHSVLFTDKDNRAAQSCYQGLGFRITGKYFVAKLKSMQSEP